jgi:hypothetical protein
MTYRPPVAEHQISYSTISLIRSMFSKSATLHNLALLMGAEKYSDIKLVCQGQEFKVHKAIVCTQSSVLAAACNRGFQVKLPKASRIELKITQWPIGGSDQ